ncbi:MAG: chemotaxis-specific protein-glutamate methyltransferase CheB [Pontixanthobacter sp.]
MTAQSAEMETMGHRALGADRMPSARNATRVMIVDDSLTVRTALARMIDAEPDLAVVHKTSSAELALAQLAGMAVDVLLLDLEMPGIGGLAALPQILSANPDLRVCIVSSLTAAGAGHTIDALAMGAADTMLKPRRGQYGDAYRRVLIEKIRALAPDRPGIGVPPPVIETQVAAPRRRPRILALGASTGGIHAICQFLQMLPDTVDLPIVVTQHLPPSFMPLFARQVQLASGRRAQVAQTYTPLRPGHIYIAPGDGHLTVRREGETFCAMISGLDAVSGCMPSVDPMLSSIAAVTGGDAIAVILSGMGRDGAQGAAALADAGGMVLAQDRISAAVWGMPGTVARQGTVTALLPPDRLAHTIADIWDRAPWK